jgi:hypothetical protein
MRISLNPLKFSRSTTPSGKRLHTKARKGRRRADAYVPGNPL